MRVGGRVGCALHVLVVLSVMAVRGAAQVPVSVGAQLQQMASHAAVIFSGVVEAVSRNDSAGFVDIRFRIDASVRGCPKTGWYVLREWAGPWTGQPERYRVGQRRLMLLTARGTSGMSSPVGGMDGAIPLVAIATAPIADASGIAPVDTGEDAPAPALDMRWIQARVLLGGSMANSRVAALGGPAKAGAVAAAPQMRLVDAISLLRGASARVAGGAGDARY